jgi:hypothetical protein
LHECVNQLDLLNFIHLKAALNSIIFLFPEVFKVRSIRVCGPVEEVRAIASHLGTTAASQILPLAT